MPIIKKTSNINVYEAARKRVINAFSNGVKIYMSFSGGKDSIVLADIVYQLILEGKIDKSLLTVIFVDEESMYDDVIKIVADWRKKFIMIGVKFWWFCLPFNHFNCLNTLEDSETWTIWDPTQKENWIRPMPPFAIKTHPVFKKGQMYQEFLPKITKDGLQIVGVRAFESIQRTSNVANIKKDKVGSNNFFLPIYDWTNADVWYHIQQRHLDFPISYMQMWQVGVSKGELRISQFFSIDTVKSLVRMAEYKPDLMERIERRQPNSYIALLYWDTEMFRRSSKNRRKLEKTEPDNKDYKKMICELLSNIDANFDTPAKRKIAKEYKKVVLKLQSYDVSNKQYKKLYEALKSNDMKKRALRAAINNIYGDYAKKTRGVIK